VSSLDEDEELDDPGAALELGVLLELDELGVDESDAPPDEELELLDGVLGEVLEPAPAEPLLIVAEPETDPPDGAALEPEGALLEDEDEPDGELIEPDGEVVDDEDDEPDGEVEVVPPRDALPVVRSHAVIRLAPSATDTAMARVESFMEPP
jgi:hypothetical protein